MTACRFLEPVDVLFLRGNKLFGDPGSYGESLIPPWPSVAAGAIRSQMLAMDGVDLNAFKENKITHPTLGCPNAPGSFTVRGFHLARRNGDTVEILQPLPADLVAARDGDTGVALARLQPTVPPDGIVGSYPLAQWPLLANDARAKPATGLWLNERGWQRYLDGSLPDRTEIIEPDTLWRIDTRVGIGLEHKHRRAAKHQLFSMQAVALTEGHGFLALIDGAEPPGTGTLRFGGDGRAASVSQVEYQPPEPDYEIITAARRCRIVLTSPGIFPDGWRLPGCDDRGEFELHGVRGRLISAAVPRAETVSGWNLATWSPKPAQRAVPAGSVYWFDRLQGDAEALRKLAGHGLWASNSYDAQRRAEGFNRFHFAIY